jgi:hypothetical protein
LTWIRRRRATNRGRNDPSVENAPGLRTSVRIRRTPHRRGARAPDD